MGTDHGSTINCGNEKAIINIPENIEEEQHGNSIKLFGDYFNQDALDELKNNIDKEKFYTIWREDLGKYGLPRNTVNEEVYGWIFPNIIVIMEQGLRDLTTVDFPWMKQ